MDSNLWLPNYEAFIFLSTKYTLRLTKIIYRRYLIISINTNVLSCPNFEALEYYKREKILNQFNARKIVKPILAQSRKVKM